MERLITYYESCTTTKCCLVFKEDNTFVAFYHTGETQLQGTYSCITINQCDIYSTDNNTIFAINNNTGLCIWIEQHEKYAYIGSTTTSKRAVKPRVEKNFNLSMCVVSLGNTDNCLTIPFIRNTINTLNVPCELVVLDYYKNKNIEKTAAEVFYPAHYVKKNTAINALIKNTKYDIVSIMSPENNIDFKFLSETLLLDNDTLLVPNIIHQSTDLHPISMRKSVFERIGGLNEDVAIQYIVINTILKCLLFDIHIKTYPAVISQKRIRGNFKNVEQSERDKIISSLKSNMIYSLKDAEELTLQNNLQTTKQFLTTIE